MIILVIKIEKSLDGMSIVKFVELNSVRCQEDFIGEPKRRARISRGLLVTERHRERGKISPTPPLPVLPPPLHVRKLAHFDTRLADKRMKNLIVVTPPAAEPRFFSNPQRSTDRKKSLLFSDKTFLFAGAAHCVPCFEKNVSGWQKFPPWTLAVSMKLLIQLVVTIANSNCFYFT